jgi:hypothetical protein
MKHKNQSEPLFGDFIDGLSDPGSEPASNSICVPGPASTARQVRVMALAKFVTATAGIYLPWALGGMEPLGDLLRPESWWLLRGIGYLLVLPICIPLVYFGMACVELTTGRPFRDAARVWNAMDEWKQGLLSFLLFWPLLGLMGLAYSVVFLW